MKIKLDKHNKMKYIVYVMRNKANNNKELKMTKLIYERMYDKLDKILPGGIEKFCSDPEGHLKLKAEGFMDLSIDVLNWKEDGKKGTFRIAIAHNFIQNGDLMADPDMEIRIHRENKMVEALTYQLDSLGIFQRVYRDGFQNTKAKRELNNFLNGWLRNIINQGHK